MTTTAATTTRTYRVRVMDACGFLHSHDIEAGSAREARRVAFASTNEETGNAVYTHDIHGVTADGRYGALHFIHDFAR